MSGSKLWCGDDDLEGEGKMPLEAVVFWFVGSILVECLFVYVVCELCP